MHQKRFKKLVPGNHIVASVMIKFATVGYPPPPPPLKEKEKYK